MTDTCPIWGSEFPAQFERRAQMLMTLVVDSPRASGGYQIEDSVSDHVNTLDQQEKARLTTWIVDQNAQGVQLPEITQEIVDYAKRRQPLPVHEKATRLLKFIGLQTNEIGAHFSPHSPELGAYAWSESSMNTEVFFLLDYLVKKGWIDSPKNAITSNLQGYYLPSLARVTVEGHSHIASEIVNIDSTQGFVAMWFDDSTKDVLEKGIELGIRDAGYNPKRIDKVEHINKIDDEIIAAIRISRFIVADFTHGRGGARGGVYFEAGLAMGREIPVFFTCHKSQLRKVHFDTRQYNHIVWETPEDLREALANRIRAVLGQGPVPVVTPSPTP